MASAATTVFVARDRGGGVIVGPIERLALAEGIGWLVLETGDCHLGRLGGQRASKLHAF
jgi:hypothetical protein